MYKINCCIVYRLISTKVEGSAFANTYKEIDYQITVNDEASNDVIDKHILVAGVEEIRKVEGSYTPYHIIDLRSSVEERQIPWH